MSARGPRRPGARSVRGSLSAYLKASVVALLLLAVALWWGWGRGDPAAAAPRVSLSASAGWRHAALESGPTLLTLQPGEELVLTPGAWRVTLVPEEGEPVVQTLSLEPGQVRELGAAAPTR